MVEGEYMRNELNSLKAKLNKKNSRINMYRNIKFDIFSLTELCAKEKSILIELSNLICQLELNIKETEEEIQDYEKEILYLG